ncbi:MAG: hypothetical protein GX259_02800 [Bacteroidales bacterium]|nr:hypothetical protein [Bacteroidales bacterium]
MNTRKFKLLCDGQLIGFIFITDNNHRFPNCKVASIWPFQRQGSWTAGDLELAGQSLITDIYDLQTTDEEIQYNLIRQARIDCDACRTFQIVNY